MKEKEISGEYYRLLREKYPTVQAAASEITNLEAILRLPKGTEHFLSDLHGEYEAFCHIMNNCSGVIREKVEALFKDRMDRTARDEFATLIYYPKAILSEKKAAGTADEEWYFRQLCDLVDLCRVVASKYTRSKVRKALPRYFDYIIDELINMDRSDFDKEAYYTEIFRSVIGLGRAEAFIIAITDLIKVLAVDKLHIVGDVFDRGDSPDRIMDLLLKHHDVDVQWGNHDIQWMGAYMGSEACIYSVIEISLKYGNIRLLEEGYGISLRTLSAYAEETMDEDPRFYPVPESCRAEGKELSSLAKMRKAAFLLGLKASGNLFARHPEYGMDERNILLGIDFSRGTFAGHVMENPSFPGVDPENPLRFSEEERRVTDGLVRSFRGSEKLGRHIDFLMRRGGTYTVCNGNLIFHGCIPLNPDGTYLSFCGHEGRDLMDWCEERVRRAYAAFRAGEEDSDALDFLYYLWCGSASPLYGREKYTAFERIYVPDPKAHEEKYNSYYALQGDRTVFERILSDFGLKGKYCHIINGHVPVRTILGESPIRADGRLIVIDGGFCKAYHKKTGIAGYTLIYNSHGLRLCAHEPFDSVAKAIEDRSDIHSEVTVFETREKRILVRDTDTGKKLTAQIRGLLGLMEHYRQKERT